MQRSVERSKMKFKTVYFAGLFGGLYYKLYWKECEESFVSRYRYYRWCYPLLSFFYNYHSEKSPHFNLKQDVNYWHKRGWKIKQKHQHLLEEMADESALAAMKERKIKQLWQKDEERKQKLVKQKEIKTKESAEEENINNVVTRFDALENDILACLKQIEDVNVPKESLPELFDSCFCKLEEWQSMISLTSHVLKIYHKKSFQLKYNNMNDRRLKLEQTFLPDKKFSFKKKTKTSSMIDVPPVDELDTAFEKKPLKKCVYKSENEFGFADKENENLILRHNEITQKDAIFRNLRNCNLNIEGGALTVHFVSLINCRILCGPVSTSIFVENCQRCKFVVACQQLRAHHTCDTDFYLHVTTRGIIEDCQRVRFAPYNWKYPDIDKHFAIVGLHREQNNWNLINDFNWLSSAPSPNWKVLEESERVVEWR